MIRAPALALPGISHAFFTRQGGVSDGIYASLNCGLGSADDRSRVLDNRAKAAAALGIDAARLATPHQVHSPNAVVVEDVWAPGAGPQVDALVTRVPGIAVGVGSADCGPVLFADSAAGVVAAAHAGWRGALGGVLEATLAAMEELGARRSGTVAVLGPTISAENYEVGPEFVARFAGADPSYLRFFRPGHDGSRSRFDLPAFIVARLTAAGAGTVVDLGLCTYADERRFFSYRRTTHRGEPDYGRLLAGIAVTGHSAATAG